MGQTLCIVSWILVLAEEVGEGKAKQHLDYELNLDQSRCIGLFTLEGVQHSERDMESHLFPYEKLNILANSNLVPNRSNWVLQNNDDDDDNNNNNNGSNTWETDFFMEWASWKPELLMGNE